jgi:hypothetical protein
VRLRPLPLLIPICRHPPVRKKNAGK